MRRSSHGEWGPSYLGKGKTVTEGRGTAGCRGADGGPLSPALRDQGPSSGPGRQRADAEPKAHRQVLVRLVSFSFHFRKALFLRDFTHYFFITCVGATLADDLRKHQADDVVS